MSFRIKATTTKHLQEQYSVQIGKLVTLDYEDIMVSILALMLTLLSPVVHRINLHMGLSRCLSNIYIYIYMNFFLYLSDFF